MRVLVALCLLVPILSGCLSDAGPDPDAPTGVASLDIRKVPGGAVLENTAEKAVLTWTDVELPFTHTFALPDGATMVRFVADPATTDTVSVAMAHAETGRRRCNQQSVVGFDQDLLGARSCSSITALDPPGTEWKVRATAPTPTGAGTEAPAPPTADVRIEFLVTPLDGLAGMLDLSQLSHATHDLQPTRGSYVTSWDGTQLWTEVTLPEGEGPWPTVIAASPYNGQTGRLGQPGGEPAMWTYWTQDWAKRGYAAVNVDVRGFGLSGGCVEVWGEREQRDQAFTVDWVASQPWSDGSVGFYGQSYVGTTPVAAAVQAPEALKAIIAVAPVINSYEDWHYGGVPNGESSLSPVAYQVLTDPPAAPDGQRTDLESIIAQSTSGVCDPTLLPRGNDPRATYNEFYEERDFKKRAGAIQAAVLFTEGFEDRNVKSAMIPGWFNEIQAPKLGVFGHWLHQHPARMDQEALFLGWMDHYVKGRDLGFDRIPSVVVSADADHHRYSDSWPSLEAEELRLYADLAGSTLSPDGGSGTMGIDLDPTGASPATVTNKNIVLKAPVAADLPVIAPTLHLKGSLDGENGFVYASLHEDRTDGTSRVLTWGMVNLALRNGYDTYDAVVPGSIIEADLPFRPTELIVGEGSTLRLTIRSVQAGEAVGTAQPQPGVFTLDGAGTYLAVPTVPMSAYEAMPVTAMP